MSFRNFPKFIKQFKWTKLDHYIFIKFIAVLIASLFLFVGIYQLTQIFQDLRGLPKGSDMNLLFQYYLYGSAYWILILQPFSFLFAIVYVLSSLGNSHELVAMISTGTSLHRITAYILLFTILYYFASIFYLNEHFTFPSYQKSIILRKIVFEKMDPNNLDQLKDNKNFSLFGSNQVLYVADSYLGIPKEINRITIVKFRKRTPIISEDLSILKSINWIQTNISRLTKERNLNYSDSLQIEMRVDARQAVWNTEKHNWKFYDGTIRYVNAQGTEFKVEHFHEKYFDFIKDPPSYFERSWFGTTAMTPSQSEKYIKKLKQSRQDAREAEANFYSKFSYPIGIIFVILAGIGIVNVSSRKISVVVNVIISLVLFVVYYILFAAGLAFSGKGILNPIIGSTMGAVVFAIISVVLYIRTKT